jgi:hypothetical protein
MLLDKSGSNPPSPRTGRAPTPPFWEGSWVGDRTEDGGTVILKTLDGLGGGLL